ncbi:MAG: FKBP-type peptidyl-prolyl cis-trans isomerase [Niabella sp.]
MRVRFMLIVFSAALLILAGCFKNKDSEPCTPKTVAGEMSVMTKYATDSSIATTEDASGLLYEIIEQGTGATPTVSSTVTVKYIGRTMSGTLFDQNTTTGATFSLSGLIKAWQIAVPKIQVGGKIKIITPSLLAYSCNPYVPAYLNNQPLYFYIELISVQ